jgi:uncharacterized membrane protein YbhN (UPF0104 family)
LSQSSPSRYSPLYTIATVLLAIAGLAYVIGGLSVESLGQLPLKQLSWWVLPAITVLHLAFLLLSAEIWRRVARALTGVWSGFGEAYLQVAAIVVGKYVPGKIWGFVARAGQMHRQQVPVHKSVLTGIVEQVLILVGAAIVAIGAGIAAFPEHTRTIGIAGLALLVGAVIVTANVPAMTRWLMRKRGYVDVAITGEKFDWAGVLRFAVGYAVLWLISGVIFAIIYFALFDVAVSIERIAALILANTTGIVVGFFAFFAPGGLGVREAATTAVLAPFLPLREALLAAIVFRAWLVLFDGANAVILIAGESRRAMNSK